MVLKEVFISSSGLGNIVLNKYPEEEDFVFVLGKQEIRMKSIFAEFISPIVSKLHQTDPTIKYINLEELNPDENKSEEFIKFYQTILTEDTISLFHQISMGSTIVINEHQANNLLFLSHLLGNKELSSKLHYYFPLDDTEESMRECLKIIQNYDNFSCFWDFIDINLYDYVARNFYLLDKEDFLKLKRRIQYLIISNPNLQVENEDFLLDIVLNIINSNCDDEEIDDISFLEQIEFIGLSEKMFYNFIRRFDINMASNQLWRKLSLCFFTNFDKKSKRSMNNRAPYMIVGGFNGYKNLLEKSNYNVDGDLTIYPPLEFQFDSSSIKSYSVYRGHSVVIGKDNSMKAIGKNNDHRISSSLPCKNINKFTEFSIKGQFDESLKPISAVCCGGGTLYMLEDSEISDFNRQLVLCNNSTYNQMFLNVDIKDTPLALFGGFSNAAVITKCGKVIFLRHLQSIDNNSTSSLPENEKASIVACCENSVAVLSTKGHVFMSFVDTENYSNILNFSIVDELKDIEIVYLSGSCDHFLAVSNDGRVFGYGSNEFGQLGIGQEIQSTSLFTEIQSFGRYKITAAYAGSRHSLFKTNNGKILSCGDNYYGELFNISDPDDIIYLPTETTITCDASFCIAGYSLSVVFMGENPPPNTPNMPVYPKEEENEF